MAKYTYHGPPSGVTLPDGTEILFWDGHTVELPTPEANDYVAGLMDRGHLVPLPKAAAPAKASKTPPADDAATKGMNP